MMALIVVAIWVLGGANFIFSNPLIIAFVIFGMILIGMSDGGKK